MIPGGAPLDGFLVLDLTRMLPGAVLARLMLDLGADVIKVEGPEGDPFRIAPPLVDGIGAGFAFCYRGAKSVVIDLRTAEGAGTLAELARRADVLVESFRSGTMERWGLGPERLLERNPRLVVCALSAAGREGPGAAEVAHDLNAVARTGALRAMTPEGVPSIQLADVGSALLAASAILAALLARERTGRGAVLDVPLVSGPLPFVSWMMAEAAAGGPGTVATLLTGRCPCYRVYRAGDGLELAVGALEPKLWLGLLEMLDLLEHAPAAWDTGEAGRAAIRAIAEAFSRRPAAHWIETARRHGVPLTAVRSVSEAAADPIWAALGLEKDGLPGPWLRPPLTRPPGGRPPALGEHDETVLAALRDRN